jgi:hypothetical protein
MNPEEQLQTQLARLEAGEPVEAVLADLPEVEAGLVRLAANLRALPQTERAAAIVAAQRQKLVRAAQETKPQPPAARTPRTSWVWPMALAGGLAALSVGAFAVVALAAGVWLWQSRAVAHQSPSTSTAIASTTSGAPTSGAPTTVAVQPTAPHNAMLTEARGLVELQTSNGQWNQMAAGQTIRAGQRLRTRDLSSATLTFYDGSQARLGPNSEMSVDALDAQKSGTRVIALTLWGGESDHVVTHSDNPASRYEVHTASGTGSARGTRFGVSLSVSPNSLARFDVAEGVVAVAGQNTTVDVVAGQSSTVAAGQAPQEPVFRIEGEGAVTQTGAVWSIAGYPFSTNASTIILGDPQPGDWVSFEGRLLADGTRFADRIILLHRRIENGFAFTGAVEVISATQWTIAGRVVRVDALTHIDDGIVVGDVAEARGFVAADGTLWALTIQKAAANAFRFAGVVETIGANAWVVSGISITVNLSTTVEPGIVAGDRVVVIGQVLPDGTWLATSIKRVSLDTFDFVGVVISTDPWVVSGKAIATDAHTEIDEGIKVGNRVRVRGHVLADGTWLADSIEQVDEGQRHHVEFTARVKSINPWVVGALTVTVDEHTQIIGHVQVGDLVTVSGNLLPDGTVVANKITLVKNEQSCFSLFTVIKSADAGKLVLFDDQTISLDQTIEVKGDLKPGAVILVRVCVTEGGDLKVMSIIVVGHVDHLPVVIIKPGDDGKNPKDCKEGPGLGLGHCKPKPSDDNNNKPDKQKHDKKDDEED